jgi:photosystem II stability/assembly factor-like uncharacterized protein
MKIKLVVVFLLLNISLFGQWIIQSQLNQRPSLRKIISVDTSHTWAVGDSGIIVFSNDKGQTWSIQDSGIKDQLQGIFFKDTVQGFAYGVNGTMLSTTNGGKNWIKDPTNYSNSTIRSMSFADIDNGWFVASGTPPILYKTLDGGKTWNLEPLSSDISTSLLKVQFVDKQNGWMMSSKRIYHTTNGGIDWSFFDNDRNIYTTFRDMQFFNNRSGYFLIDQYLKIHLGRTTNGGLRWSLDSSFTPASGSPFFQFKDSLNGCSGGGNFIGTTTDGGKNWNLTKKLSVNSICIIDSNHLAAVGFSGTKLYTTDQGKTWVDFTPPALMTLTMVKYQSPSFVWAVGGKSILLLSTDQGTTWRRIGIPSGIGINGMTFPDTTHGWVLDDSARIFLTKDFGNTWIQQTTGLTKGLRSIYFTDSLFGCTVGDNGVTFITTNGGTNWNNVVNSTLQTLFDVFFINKTNGWAVGQFGTIVRASESGKIWKEQTSPTTVTLRSISFSDSLHGTIVGDSGIVLRTINGGDSWEIHSLKNSLNYRSVKMLGLKGWIVGDSGRIYSSTNSGQQWNIQQSNTTASLFGVDFVNQNIGSIVGEGTTVLVTKNGGLTGIRNDGSSGKNISFSLENNFPNPFNPSTTINYMVQQSGIVRISIYNVIGQYIETILHEIKEKGSYSVRWSPKNLPSGIYFYQLEVGGESKIRKMVFLK